MTGSDERAAERDTVATESAWRLILAARNRGTQTSDIPGWPGASGTRYDISLGPRTVSVYFIDSGKAKVFPDLTGAEHTALEKILPAFEERREELTDAEHAAVAFLVRGR